jgi:hypothetical protein
MIIGRFFGWVFLVCGLLVLARDCWASYDARTWAPIALGQLWYDISRSSLVLAQAGIQRYVSVRAWDVIDQMLSVWACAALLLIGIGLLIAFRRRQDVIQ